MAYSSSGVYVGNRVFIWLSTSAVTSIVITAGGAFAAGTGAILYGRA
jgi:hypothetical protein